METVPVRMAVIGCGAIGGHHLRHAVASPLIEPVAVCDLSEDLARAAAEKFDVPGVYTDAAEVFADDRVEAVVLAIPTAPRTGLALQAFAQGKHVLTEKPVAMNAGEVREMIAAKGDLVAACCSARHHFLPSTEAAARFMATRPLGELRTVHCRNFLAARPRPESLPPPWRLSRAMNGGGILSNWGCYDLDYLLGLTGWTLKPRTVMAQTWRVPAQFESHVPPGSDADTHYSAFILCDNGVVITFERGEYMPAAAESCWQIIGEKGTLQLQMMAGKGKRIVHDDTSAEKGVFSSVLWEGDEEYGTAHAALIGDFAAAIREGRPPQTSLERALVVQEITDAIYASAEQGRPIELG